MCIKGTIQFDYDFLKDNWETYLGSKYMLKELMTKCKMFYTYRVYFNSECFIFINVMLWKL